VLVQAVEETVGDGEGCVVRSADEGKPADRASSPASAGASSRSSARLASSTMRLGLFRRRVGGEVECHDRGLEQHRS
jgi:hypothetical protein